MPALGIFFASVFFLIWDASRCLLYDLHLSDAIGNLTVSLVVLIFNLYVSHSRSFSKEENNVSSFTFRRFLVSITRISEELFLNLNPRQFQAGSGPFRFLVAQSAFFAVVLGTTAFLLRSDFVVLVLETLAKSWLVLRPLASAIVLETVVELLMKSLIISKVILHSWRDKKGFYSLLRVLGVLLLFS